jgi:hypothetical protein
VDWAIPGAEHEITIPRLAVGYGEHGKVVVASRDR